MTAHLGFTLACMLAINAMAFVAGFLFGRFGERRAVTRWLERHSRADLNTVELLEDGRHRQARP